MTLRFLSLFLWLTAAACGGTTSGTRADTAGRLSQPWSIEVHRAGMALRPDGSPDEDRLAVQVGPSGARWRDAASEWSPLEAETAALEEAVGAVHWEELVEADPEAPVVGGERIRFRFERPAGALEVARYDLTPELRRVHQELTATVEAARANQAAAQPAAGQPSEACAGRCADGERCESAIDQDCPECDVEPIPLCVRADGTSYRADL